MAEKKMLISPSILSADMANLGDAVAQAEAAGADWIHVDVMDGRFVPNITIGIPVVAALKKGTRLPLDVHLMITDPDRYLEQYRDAGADWLTVHYETCPHLHRTVQRIRELGMEPGVSLNPHTDVSLLENILPYLNMVLIMTVNPGFGGQTFIEASWNKIRRMRNMIDQAGSGTLIQVDGGVTEKNVGDLVEAGVDVFVVGNTIFSAEDPLQVIRNLKNPA